MYDSPIKIIYGKMLTQMEGDILMAVQNYDIQVDKEELEAALLYDRNQYNKGYNDGFLAGIEGREEVVHCRDCCYEHARIRLPNGIVICGVSGMKPKGEDDFCSCGEKD